MGPSPDPPPPSAEVVLDRFLIDAPPHPVEIHITDEVQRRSVGNTVGEWISDEVVHTLLGTEPMPENQLRQIRVQWLHPDRVAASVTFNGASKQHEILRRTLIAARRHRCVVRWWYRGGSVIQASSVDIFNVPRVVGSAGKVGRHAAIVDTPERFDVMFGKIDRPGMVGRRVLRRSEVEETWRVVLDRTGLSVTRVRRKGTDEVSVPLSELVAVAKSSWASSTLPTQSILTTKEVVEFPRLSFLGRSFGLNGNDAWDFERFVVQRINQRLGI